MKSSTANSIFALVLLLTGTGVLAQTASTPSRKIEIPCGQHKVAITCGKVFDPDYPQDKRECNHNTLSFIDQNGKVYMPPMPKKFDKTKTPVSMGCTQGNDGRYYVTVEFNNGPRGCGPCLTYHLFESNGNRLTSDLTDRMPQYGNASKKLDIHHINSIHIEGESK